MPEFELDCKTLPCPQPVLKLKQAIEAESPDVLRVVVDNEAARENVTRFFGSRGYAARSRTLEDGSFAVTGTREGAAPAEDDAQECRVMSPAEMPGAQKVTVFVTADAIGRGDDELGAKLMQNFLATLPELGDELWRVVLVNSGVRLATRSNPAFEKLEALEKMGAKVLVCGTCLDHFGLLEKKGVGETTNMLDVVTSLQAASKVIQV